MDGTGGCAGDAPVDVAPGGAPKLKLPEKPAPEDGVPPRLNPADEADGLGPGPKENSPDGLSCLDDAGAPPRLKPPAPVVTALAPPARTLLGLGWDAPVDPRVWANLLCAAWMAAELGMGGCAALAACFVGRAAT